MDQQEQMANFLYEMGHLKRVKRSGWWVAGISDPESVADHTVRTAQLGYILALLEGADAQKTALMCLFHDTHETRINDLHRVAKYYIDTKAGEKRAFHDQVRQLPEDVGGHITAFINEYEERQSTEAIIAKDADCLECMIQAREYQSQGNQNVQEWIVNNRQMLKTRSAQQLADACLRVPPDRWWRIYPDQNLPEGDS